MSDFEHLRGEPRLSPADVESELGHVVARGRRQKARRRAAIGSSLAVAAVVSLVATAVALRGPGEESGIRAAGRPDQTTSTEVTVPVETSVPVVTAAPPTTLPPVARPSFAVVVRPSREATRSGEAMHEEIALIDAESGKDLRTIYRTGGDVLSIALSPDRKHVYLVQEFCGAGAVERISVDGGSDQTTEQVTTAPSADPAISPDGRFLAYLAFGGCEDYEIRPKWTLRVRNLRDNSERVIAEEPEGFEIGEPAWAPDGRSLAVAVSRVGDASMVEAFLAVLDPGKERQDALKARRVSSPRPGFGFMSPTYLPNGSLFVVETPLGSGRGKDAPLLVVVDGRTGRTARHVATGDPQRAYSGTDADVTGTHLAYVSHPADRDPGELRVSSAGGRTTVLATGITAVQW